MKESKTSVHPPNQGENLLKCLGGNILIVQIGELMS